MGVDSPQMGHTQDASPYFLISRFRSLPHISSHTPYFLACLLLTKVAPSLSHEYLIRFLSPNTQIREDLELDDNEAFQIAVQKEYADLLQKVTNRHKQGNSSISAFVGTKMIRARPLFILIWGGQPFFPLTLVGPT